VSRRIISGFFCKNFRMYHSVISVVGIRIRSRIRIAFGSKKGEKNFKLYHFLKPTGSSVGSSVKNKENKSSKNFTIYHSGTCVVAIRIRIRIGSGFNGLHESVFGSDEYSCAR
jgi:hypothetical protein